MKNKYDMNAKQLTAKQERFCEEYLVDLNATKAATRARRTHINGRQPALYDPLAHCCRIDADRLAEFNGIHELLLLEDFQAHWSIVSEGSSLRFLSSSANANAK